MRKAHDECLPMLSEYSSWAGQYKPYFDILKTILASDAFSLLSLPQQKSIKNSIRDFKLSGIDLEKDKQEEYVKIQTRLSELTSQFANNVLDATHSFTLHVTDESQIKGLPQTALSLARDEAKAKELDGYVFTLEYPSYGPFMTYCENRELREKMYKAYVSRASELGPDGGKWDNGPVMEEIMSLRAKRQNF